MFGRRAKIRKAVNQALARVTDDADLADHAPIEALKPELRVQAYYTLAQALVDDERYAAAKHTLARALTLAPEEADLHELDAQIARELGLIEPAIDALRRAITASPGDAAATLSLAELLIASARTEEAIVLLRSFPVAGDREIDARLAEALFVHGETEAALQILDRVCAAYHRQLREPWSVTDRNGLIARARHADHLRSDVYAELHGREATIDLAAARGTLNARAGVNFRLLGARLASSGPRVAEILTLQDPDTTEARGRAAGASSASGLALVGSAQLRRGDLGAARKTFERASELDGRCFAAFFGIGAVLDHEQHQLHRRAAALAMPRDVPASIARVVPDWPVLTDHERNVVLASVKPFVAQLPGLAERGVTMRVLPIDVRATDVDLFEAAAGTRNTYDHRSYDALGGVATLLGAIAKVEGLLDISDHGWTFAHEFAHLVYFHLDEARAAPFVELFARASKVRYANIDYALKNDDELFAVTYTDYLRQRYELARETIEDDAGIQAALMSYFAQLCE